MFSKITELFSYYSFSNLDQELNQSFIEWRQEHTYRQIAYISFVTATLYIFLSFINRFILPDESASNIANMQLFIIAPYVFILSFLAYKKKKFLYVELLLFFAPLYALFFHTIILSKFPSPNIYQVELYLMIFWIFTISGLRLIHATITSLIVFITGVVSTYLFYPNEYNYQIMHTAWLLVSLIFGFSGGYLLEESQKSTFLKQKELENLALSDKLTGLFNRFKLEETITNELETATRYNRSFGVIIFDIDFFKSVNDNFGHQVGDEILVNISQTVQQQIRHSDTLFRWGGEEFILICLEVNRSEIELIAENIRQKVEAIQHHQVNKLTISLGVTLRRAEDSVDSIIKRADEALYVAKNSGRNCVKYL